MKTGKSLSIFVLLFLTIAVLFLACGGGGDGDSHEKVMFFSSNWGPDSVKITDDLYSFADGETATPREIIGPNTQLTNPAVDSLFVDKAREVIYVADSGSGEVYVFNSAKTASGNISPDRTIAITGASRLEGIEVDTGSSDRLYVTGSDGGGGHLWIFNTASTINGTPTPNATIDGVDGSTIFLDTINDRLYIGGDYNETIYVFDNASSLTSSSTPDRTITWTQGVTGFNGPPGLWVDTDTDRMYVSSNSITPGGNHLVVFSNASFLTGATNLDTGSVARISGHECISVMVDDYDRLYTWTDSATNVKIYNNASTLSGDIFSGPDKAINGVVDRGYGMDYLFY